MKNLLNRPIDEVKFVIKNDQALDHLSTRLSNLDGTSNIKIELNNLNNKLIFKLKNKRKIDRKSINLIKNKDISTIIN